MADRPAHLDVTADKPITKENVTPEQSQQIAGALAFADPKLDAAALAKDGSKLWAAVDQFKKDHNIATTAMGVPKEVADAINAADDEKAKQDMEKAQAQAKAATKGQTGGGDSSDSANASPENALVMLLAAMLMNWLSGKDPADFGALIDNVTSGRQNGSYHAQHNVTHYDASHHNAKLDSAEVKKNAAELVDEFQKLGYTKEQACGIVGNVINESGCDPHAAGDFDKVTGKPTSFGIIQLHASRVTNYNHWADSKGYPHIQDEGTTIKQQAEFVDYELRTTERSAGDHLRQAKTASEAARIFALEDERMADTVGQPSQRMANADELMKNTTIPTKAPDTPLVAKNERTDGHSLT